MKPNDMTDAEYNDLILRLLELKDEDWKDFDRRVMAAKILRLHEQVRALEAHHRANHASCGKRKNGAGSVIESTEAAGKFLAA